MKKHILPILLVLLMILLAGCSKPSGLPQNTEISSSSVGQFSELKQDENLTDEPSISTTENTASSTENKVVSEPTESQEKEDKKPASSESKPTEETPKTTEKAENKPAETKPAETQQTEPTQPKTNPTEESKEPETESEPEPVYQVPEDFRAELMKQDEPEAREIALAIELFTHGSLNTFAKQTNVDTNNRLICYDILDLGKQLMPELEPSLFFIG